MWTLVIILLGTGAPTISTDMRFVDEASCRQAGQRMAPVLDQASDKPIIACVPTPGRE